MAFKFEIGDKVIVAGYPADIFVVSLRIDGAPYGYNRYCILWSGMEFWYDEYQLEKWIDPSAQVTDAGCICPIWDLMREGCKCGGFQREQEKLNGRD